MKDYVSVSLLHRGELIESHHATIEWKCVIRPRNTKIYFKNEKVVEQTEMRRVRRTDEEV